MRFNEHDSNDPERSTLAVLGKYLGNQGLETSAAKPDTILAWFRKLVAQKRTPADFATAAFRA